MQVTPKEHPIALQLFGSDPEVMGEIAKRVEERPFDIIDVNMGCPVPKVVNNGEGSALMKIRCWSENRRSHGKSRSKTGNG